MKNAIKLLVLAGALLSVGAMAQYSKNTAYNFYFPYYAAIYTNVTQVDFFNSTTGTEGALIQNNIADYYHSTKTGVLACLDANSNNLPNSYTVGGSGGSASLSCNFAPNAVTKDQGFSVDGYQNASATADTDGELLIITNSSTFDVSVSTSGSIADATIYTIADYINNTPALANSKTGVDASAATFDENDAYDTQYSNAKVIPLLFYASVDVLNASAISSAETMTVTWQVSAP